MTRRGWVLFGAMALIWGVPYFFIRVAVEELEPAVVVFGRTSLSAVLLLAVAHRTGGIRPALARWRPVAAFAIVEMAIPWILLTTAEQHIPSGLAALLISSVPIVGAVAAFVLGDRTALRPVRLVGIASGLGGVVLLVVCVCYATAPFIISRKLQGVPSLGVISLSLALVAVIYAPIAAWSWPSTAPHADTVLSVLGLAFVCTALAFVVFFQLIDVVGPARASVITFVNPVVAIALGAVFLDEVVTAATVVGFVLVLSGCWLATRPAPGTAAAADDEAEAALAAPGA